MVGRLSTRSGERATLNGGLGKSGPMKRYPDHRSAPHTYATDGLSLVLSGTWWINSGADFDPDNTNHDRPDSGGRSVAVPALVRRGEPAASTTKPIGKSRLGIGSQ